MAVNVNNSTKGKPIVGSNEIINTKVVIIKIFIYKLNFSFFQTFAIAKINKGTATDEINNREANMTKAKEIVNFVNSNKIKAGSNRRIRAKPILKLVTIVIEVNIDNFFIKSGDICLNNKATANT